MKRLILLTLFIVIANLLHAQIWDAGGDGTSWDDADNWDTNTVPAAGDIVTFGTGGTVDLTTMAAVTDFPSRVLVTTGTNLDINLDLTIGDGAIVQHGLKGQASTTITIKSGNTLTINVPTNREGIQNNATNGGVVTIESGATVDIIQARDGVQNTTGNTVNVNGTLTINGANRDGISSAGVLTNTGDIMVVEAGDDGIDINAGTFTNDGTVDVSRNTGTASGEYGIDVNGTGTLENNSEVIIDGSTTTNSNAISLGVLVGGTVTNNSMITLSNGNSARAFFVDGTLTNAKGAIVDLTDRRSRVNDGALTNNGLVLSTFTAAAIFISGTGTAVNNAFYDFAGFGWSNSGTDNGINLADAADLAIDAGGSCTIDLAEVACPWSYDGSSIGTATSTGSLTLPNDTFTADPATITNNDFPSYGPIEIVVSNFCPQALPIELASFNAKERNGDVTLDWVTASEINSDYVAVERSRSNKNWELLTEVRTQGYSSAKQEYQYIDRDVAAGNIYYRLKMVDLDGYYEYSDVRQITIERINSNISVYPTTVTRDGTLTADLSNVENQIVTIMAYNMNGTITNLGVYDTENIVNLDMSNLTPGLKIIEISGVGFSETYKVILAN